MPAIDYRTKSFLLDLARFIKPYKLNFFVAAFFRFTSDLAALYPPIAVSQLVLVLTALEADVENKVMLLILFWILAMVWHEIGHHLGKYWGFRVAEMASMDARIQTTQHIYKLDLAWQEKENTGNKLKKVNNGQAGIKKIIQMFFVVVIEASLNTVAVIGIFFNFDPAISILLILFAIIFFAASLRLTKSSSEQTKKVSQQEEDLEGWSFESLNNIRTVKSLNIGKMISQMLIRSANKTLNELLHQNTLFRIRSVILQIIFISFEIVITIFIIRGIIKGEFNVALLILFRSYYWRLGEAVQELSELTHDFLIAKIGVGRMMAVLKTKPTIEGIDGQLDYPNNWQEINLQNISFAYGETGVLSEINLKIKRGEKIGIVGISGAGKSTLFKLLMDLYEDYQGEILFDKVSLREIDRGKYIDHVAVVLQETELFNASLKENILIAGVKPEDENVNACIEAAELKEVVQKLPQGENTIIGEKGVKLSGGEKQRLGIARALFRKPDILLMDEATSHLDVDSEKKIQASLQNIFAEVTAIVIAHRLSTIKEMDRIIVMQKGKIVEEGSFEVLVKKDGYFAELWKKQRL